MFKALLFSRVQALWNSMFNRLSRRKKMGAGSKIGVGFLVLYLVVVLGASLGGMAFSLFEIARGTDFQWLAFAAMGFMGLLLSVVGSIFTAQKQLFDAKDNDLLLAMPIPPLYILASRLAMLFLMNFAFTALTLIPAGVVWLILGISVTLPGVLFWLLSLILLPMLSMAIVSMLGWASEAISSRMKRKNLATTAIMVLFLGAYMYFCFNMTGFMNVLMEQGETIAAVFRKVLLPFYCMGSGIMEGDLPAFLIFAACTVLPFALVAWLLTKTFLKLVTTKKAGVKAVYVEKKAKENSVLGAVLKKETGLFFSMPSYVLNCGLGAIMMLLLGGALVLKGDELLQITGALDAVVGDGVISQLLPAMLQVAVGFCVLMTCSAAPSISLEGKNLWLLRSMPVPAETVLQAKLLLNVLLAGIPALLTGILINIALPMGPVHRIAAVLLPLTLSFFTGVFGLWCNLKWPRLDWINATTVVKQSGSVLAAILGGMGILMIPVVLYAVFLNKIFAPDWYLMACTAVFAMVSAILYRNIMTKGKDRFESLA